jgi:hypothetical protein
MSTRTNYEFSLYLGVDDPARLYEAARAQYFQEDYASVATGPVEDDIKDLLGTREEPDIEACLMMLLDPGMLPGCSIYQHTVEGEGGLRTRLAADGLEPGR